MKMPTPNKFHLNKRRFLFIWMIAFFGVSQNIIAQSNTEASSEEESGFSIKVIYPGHAGEQIILGHYYDYMVMGDIQIALDDNSSCLFSGPSPLKGGLYTFIVNGQTVQGDFIIDKDQHFIVYLNDEITNGSIFQDFEGSLENDKLLEYQGYMAELGEQISHYHQLLSLSTDANESLKYTEALDDIERQIREHRARVVRDAPSSTLGMILSALVEPELPANLKNPQNKKDSLAAREFMSDHFWDGTNFWDGRLANTPFISDKLDRFFAEILIPKNEGVIKEIDNILSNAVADSMLYRLILRKVIFGSKDHYYKWDDAVFIHLYENYLGASTDFIFSKEERTEIDAHAFFLMGNTSGALAPDITLPDFDNNSCSLGDLEAKFTVLAFWDPTCDHCKVVLPKLDSLYRHVWKQEGIKVFAVGVESDATEKEWRSYINDNQLMDWKHVYYSRESIMEMARTGKQLVTKSYDVWYFPAFFLLDKEKKFMARKLSFKKMTELINSILKEK